LGSIDHTGVKSEEETPEGDDNGYEVNVDAFGIVLSHDDEVILKYADTNIRKNATLLRIYYFNFSDIYNVNQAWVVACKGFTFNSCVMKNLYVLALISILLLSCSDGDDPDPRGCDLGTVISQERYRNAPSDELTINSLEIEDDCLKINFSASGCDGESWKIVLIDSGSIKESDPPQRDLRLILENNEMCEAFITRELTFNISELKVEGGRVWLNLSNSEDRILYEY
jgi:hypothetical protein